MQNRVPSTFKPAIAIRKAATAMIKHFATRQVCDAPSTRNCPNMADINTTTADALFLIYRPKKNLWDGPHTLIDIQMEDIAELTQNKISKSCGTYLKPYASAELLNDRGDSKKLPQSSMEDFRTVGKQSLSNIIKFHRNQQSHPYRFISSCTAQLD